MQIYALKQQINTLIEEIKVLLNKTLSYASADPTSIKYMETKSKILTELVAFLGEVGEKVRLSVFIKISDFVKQTDTNLESFSQLAANKNSTIEQIEKRLVSITSSMETTWPKILEDILQNQTEFTVSQINIDNIKKDVKDAIEELNKKTEAANQALEMINNKSKESNRVLSTLNQAITDTSIKQNEHLLDYSYTKFMWLSRTWLGISIILTYWLWQHIQNFAMLDFSKIPLVLNKDNYIDAQYWLNLGHIIFVNIIIFTFIGFLIKFSVSRFIYDYNISIFYKYKLDAIDKFPFLESGLEGEPQTKNELRLELARFILKDIPITEQSSQEFNVNPIVNLSEKFIDSVKNHNK